jgi:hypothetical protein
MKLPYSIAVLVLAVTVPVSTVYAASSTDLPVVPIGSVINDLYQYALSIVGLCVFFMFLLAGLAYMVPFLRKKIGDPMQIIQDAVVGLIILLAASIILKAINPDLVILTGTAPTSPAINQQ